MPILDRLADKFTVGDGCWEWTGARSRGGYGMIYPKWRGECLAHRVVFTLMRGPVPHGLQLDHLCRNRACVNPAHLEPVTNRENILRGVTAPAVNVLKTHCDNGHEFTDENTRARSGGNRDCRGCHRERNQAYYRRGGKARRATRRAELREERRNA